MRNYCNRTIGLGAPLGIGLLVLLMSVSGLASEQQKVHVVVVANNTSLDDDVPPLRFADDDGAKYFELFEASGANVSLLSSLDDDAKDRFPKADQQSMRPTLGNLLGQIQKVFAQIEADNQNGFPTQFVFVYTGHGNVGSNHEGYINLADERFTRSDLYHKIIAKSPATYNHLILDACHSYFFVKKRGGESDKTGDYQAHIRAFLQKEELSSYPNTGVILAASSESETHEWSRLESGIFSHELASCLLGAGDINGDQIVTYDEAAGCIEAANDAIKVPRARLKVFYQAPTQKLDEPLMRLASFDGSTKLTMPRESADRYFVEDARGVRILDVNYTSEQPIVIALVGQQPFFVMSRDREAIIDGSVSTVSLAELTFEAKSTGHKGAVERSFRKHLFETPFGKEFFAGLLASRSSEIEFAPAEPRKIIDPDPQSEPVDESVPPFSTAASSDHSRSPLRITGLTSLGLGLGFGVASGLLYLAASRAHTNYGDASDYDAAANYKDATNTRLLASRILLGSAIGFTALGSTLLIVKAVREKKERASSAKVTPTPIVAATDGGVFIGLSRKF